MTNIRFLYIPFLLFFILSACGKDHSPESSFINEKWQETVFKKGVTYKYIVDVTIRGSQQTIHIVEVDTELSDYKIDVAHQNGELVKTSILASKVEADIAINGNFFDPDQGDAVCYFMSQGTKVNPTIPDPDEILFLDMLDEAAIAIQNGRPEIVEKPSAGWEKLSGFETVLSSGPLLIMDGAIQQQEDIDFMNNRHARTAFGIGEGKVFLVVVDGYMDQASGMSINDLSSLMLELGSTAAINLDGGGSSTLWVDDENGERVLNYPTDNDTFDHQGERAVANAVVIHTQ